MCGITGWVDFGRDLRGEGERAAIEAMTATMICRGPDAGGTWCSAHAAIGHRRLSVIDLAGGAQPMRAPGEDDVVLTFSGEIYNFTELRHELAARGHEFRTRSDTEVLLHGYLEWGADCVRRLNGMFAFGVWDGRRQELLLARDRLGVKPLYYAARPDGVLFGSEPKSVFAHPDFRAEIDAVGLAELFSQVGTGTPGHGVYRGLSRSGRGRWYGRPRRAPRVRLLAARGPRARRRPRVDGRNGQGTPRRHRAQADRRRRAAVQPPVGRP